MQDKLIKISKENEDLIKINQASERDKTELKELKKIFKFKWKLYTNSKFCLII